jgi:sugar phosphate isomerase/epimerase
MIVPTHRRQFLLRASAIAAAALSPRLFRSSPYAAAIDPFDRPQSGPLKLSLAAYSFRTALSPAADSAAPMSLFDLVDFCRDHDVAGVELTSYYFPENFDDTYLLMLRRHCHLQGVSVSGGAIRNDFCVAAEDRGEQMEHVRKWIDAYAMLGAPAIRIFAGSPPAGVSRSEAIDRCVAACEEACQYAAEKGIFLALENHHGITDTASSMLEVVRQVQSPWFGVNFDSGNFKVGQDPYAELEMIAPYAINAQVKIEIWENNQKVAADLPKIVEILKQAGYGGWVVLEYEGSEPAAEAIPVHLEQLAKLID